VEIACERYTFLGLLFMQLKPPYLGKAVLATLEVFGALLENHLPLFLLFADVKAHVSYSLMHLLTSLAISDPAHTESHQLGRRGHAGRDERAGGSPGSSAPATGAWILLARLAQTALFDSFLDRMYPHPDDIDGEARVVRTGVLSLGKSVSPLMQLNFFEHVREQALTSVDYDALSSALATPLSVAIVLEAACIRRACALEIIASTACRFEMSFRMDDASFRKVIDRFVAGEALLDRVEVLHAVTESRDTGAYVLGFANGIRFLLSRGRHDLWPYVAKPGDSPAVRLPPSGSTDPADFGSGNTVSSLLKRLRLPPYMVVFTDEAREQLKLEFPHATRGKLRSLMQVDDLLKEALKGVIKSRISNDWACAMSLPAIQRARGGRATSDAAGGDPVHQMRDEVVDEESRVHTLFEAVAAEGAWCASFSGSSLPLSWLTNANDAVFNVSWASDLTAGEERGAAVSSRTASWTQGVFDNEMGPLQANFDYFLQMRKHWKAAHTVWRRWREMAEEINWRVRIAVATSRVHSAFYKVLVCCLSLYPGLLPELRDDDVEIAHEWHYVMQCLPSAWPVLPLVPDYLETVGQLGLSSVRIDRALYDEAKHVPIVALVEVRANEWIATMAATTMTRMTMMRMTMMRMATMVQRRFL
jgi:hypothetical protein